MTICDWCAREMTDDKIVDCTKNRTVEYPDGKILPSVPYDISGNSFILDEENHRCHDCGIKPGMYHHPGCDMEECPRCGGQLISCRCLEEDDEEEIIWT